VFRVIDMTVEGALKERSGPDKVRPPTDVTCRWVDLIQWDDESLALLGERFGFHPLAIEDCSTFELHSKVEEYPDHLFIVLHAFTEDPEQPFEIEIHEIHAFLHDDYLVTVHDKPVISAEAVWERAKHDARVLRSSGWALHAIADGMVDALFPLLRRIAAELERLETVVLGDPSDEELAKIFQLRGTLVSMRRVIRPLRDVIKTLSRRKQTPLSKRTALYFRDVYDHVISADESIEEAQGLVESAMDAYNSSVSNRTNEIMAKLTIFSVVFLPLAWITGFWGMNFDHLPISSEALFYVNLGVMITLPLGLLIWFRGKGWL
jgi:magnesium transporter